MSVCVKRQRAYKADRFALVEIALFIRRSKF
jgi:hypothetical protein